MAGEWRDPLPAPMFASALGDLLLEREREAGEKEQAFATPFRFSGAHDCARKLGLRYAGFPASNPMDVPALIVVERGTLMHELVQMAIAKRFPQAEFEIKGIVQDVVSGHVDALIELDGVLYVWELKNVGGFKFDKAVGIVRTKGGKRVEPDGPGLAAVTQAGLNALAHKAEFVVVAYISMEAISKQVAMRLSLAPYDRIMAEWLIPRSVWEPLAVNELNRLREIRDRVDNGWLPVGAAVDDRGQIEWLSPHDARPKWRCEYCSHRDLCESLPAQNVTIEQIPREA